MFYKVFKKTFLIVRLLLFSLLLRLFLIDIYHKKLIFWFVCLFLLIRENVDDRWVFWTIYFFYDKLLGVIDKLLND